MPIWVILLDIANGDPIRARQIEEEISYEWWERTMTYRKEQTEAQKEMERKAKRG